MEQERGSHSPLFRPPLWFLMAIVTILLIVAMVFVGYRVPWTGFASTVTKEVTRTIEAGGHAPLKLADKKLR